MVAVSGKVTCPVNIMNRYLDKAQLSHDSPLFCQLSKGAYHLLELAGPKELVFIGVNGKVKAGPRDY